MIVDLGGCPLVLGVWLLTLLSNLLLLSCTNSSSILQSDEFKNALEAKKAQKASVMSTAFQVFPQQGSGETRESKWKQQQTSSCLPQQFPFDSRILK
jgi:hypothetical protein